MHEPLSSDDRGAVDFGKALVTNANAEHRNPRTEVFDDISRQSSFGRSTGAGRDDDSLGVKIFDLLERDLIIALDAYFRFRVNFTNSLHEVVSERIVVIEQKDHRGEPTLKNEKHGAADYLSTPFIQSTLQNSFLIECGKLGKIRDKYCLKRDSRAI